MAIREELKLALPKAMKARQSSTVIILRSILAAIDNAEAVPAVEVNSWIEPVIGKSSDVPRKILSETQIQTIIQREIDDYKSAIAKYQQLGKDEEADQVASGLAGIDRYMTALLLEPV